MPWRKNCNNTFPMTSFAKRGFSYELTRVGNRTLLEAKCLNCGQRTVVSTYDGSLQRWEHSHKCKGQSEGFSGNHTDPLTPEHREPSRLLIDQHP